MSKKLATKDFDINDLDHLLNSDIGHVDDNDLNMDDPELLKQLQALTSSSPSLNTPKPKPKTTLQNMDVDIDAYTALAQGDDDIEVELDENDLNDPNLLNELSSLTQSSLNQETKDLMNMGFSQQQAEDALAMFDNNIERAANYLFDSPPPPEEKEDWKGKAQRYQRLALEAKKQGDKKKAVALLRESKEYHMKYQESLQHDDVKLDETPLPENQYSNPPKDEHSQEPAAVHEVPKVEVSTMESLKTTTDAPIMDAGATTITPNNITSTATEISNTEKPPAVSPQETQVLLSQVIDLQKQYKQAALHYKKVGNFPVAKQMVRTSKDLLHLGIRIKTEGYVQDLELPEQPNMSLGDGKTRPLEQNSLSPNPQSSENIRSQLTYQMNVCHNLSLQSMLTKKHRQLLNDTHPLTKLEAALARDLTIESQTYHYEMVHYSYINMLDEIPDNVMQLKIMEAVHLPTLDISGALEPFVTWDLGGWPPETSPQASMNKGETPVAKDGRFDYTLQVPISRSRPFQRYLQRRKLTIEVFHNRYTYGLFRRPVSLGKVVIPLDQLLTKTSISGIFDLMESGRKKTGGKIELQVNLREPLMEKDIVKRSERWMVLDGSEVSTCLVAAGLTTTTSYTLQPSPSPSPSPSPAVEKDKLQQQQQQPSITDNEFETAEDEFNNVDNLVSNMVLEHELKLVNSELSTQPMKEELIDRKQALEIKMNMLVIQVQTGLLDMTTYLKQVEDRMEKDRRLAIVFKRHGRLDLAKAALVRKKIMQDELEEAKAAMMTE
ncbi:MAG: hypothetical protein EXX96DRAFT_598711 [Benjaminiella poitrasii]|nr:MAG: hypothetical protein EXX96DRAFT_598711 [Benjaminiella poitrasii]